MNRILITSFEPFGLSGRFLRRANAAHDIAAVLQERLPATDFSFLRLPVSDRAHGLLQEHLEQEKPAAILGLGENLSMLPGQVNLEPYAYDRDASLNPFAGSGGTRISSDFVRQVSPHGHSTIGAFFCNAIYRQSLLWAQDQHATRHDEKSPRIPVAFMHVAVLGKRDRQLAAVSAVLEDMQRRTTTPQPAFKP
ncbi:MAG TPA: hypothetical protein VGD95_05450 [Micavibrio sp.]